MRGGSRRLKLWDEGPQWRAARSHNNSHEHRSQHSRLYAGQLDNSSLGDGGHDGVDCEGIARRARRKADLKCTCHLTAVRGCRIAQRRIELQRDGVQRLVVLLRHCRHQLIVLQQPLEGHLVYIVSPTTNSVRWRVALADRSQRPMRWEVRRALASAGVRGVSVRACEHARVPARHQPAASPY